MEYKESYAYKGWENCISVENDSLKLIFTADVGPRILSFGFKDGINMFYENEDDMGKTGGKDWRIYGGTRLWHAPEMIPRTYFPDNEPVKHEWDGRTLKLTQETEETTGLQKEIEVIIPEKGSSIGLKYRMFNRNLWPVKFALWALSVMDKNGIAIIPHEPYQTHSENLLPVRPVVFWAYTDLGDPRWIWGSKYIRLRQRPDIKEPQKIGLLNKQGWAAYSLKDNIFIKKFDYSDGKDYPDYQSNLEIYTDANILELETLSSFNEVEPGGSAEHTENWSLFKVEAGLDGDESQIDTKILPLL